MFKSIMALVVVGVLGYGSTARAGDYRSAVLADKPVAYFRMNEAPGATTAQNDANALQVGAYLGGANTTLGVTGPRPPAFGGFESNKTGAAFNSDNSAQLEITSVSTLSTTDYSYEVWINHSASAILQYIGGRGDTSKYDAIGLNGNTLGFYNGADSAFDGISVSENVWHDIILTRSGTTIKIYVDGVVGFSGTYANLFAGSTAPQRIIVGTRPDNAAVTAGTFADLSVYNTALTPEQVAAHYHAAVTGK